MTPDCGRFVAPEDVKVDIAGVEAKFGSVTGVRATVWKLSSRAPARLRKASRRGLERGADGEVSDPDEAFAYLVALNVAEKVSARDRGHSAHDTDALPAQFGGA